jgi:putative hemolysin
MLAIETLAKIKRAAPPPAAAEPGAFHPKLSFALDLGTAVVKTVDTADELLDVLRLRHQVFYEEVGRRHPTGIDFDAHDLDADHVVVRVKGEAAPIATYRLLSSHFVDSFYSEHEFQLGGFLRSPGVKLELGRACVAPAFRNGLAMSLIWKGVARYVHMTKADQLFGCSTVWSDDARVAWALHERLETSRCDRYLVAPQPDYEHPWSARGTELPEGTDFEALIPPLLQAYLRLGARVHGAPAWDREFRCTDFFTVLELREMDPRYYARFFGRAGSAA